MARPPFGDSFAIGAWKAIALIVGSFGAGLFFAAGMSAFFKLAA